MQSDRRSFPCVALVATLLVAACSDEGAASPPPTQVPAAVSDAGACTTFDCLELTEEQRQQAEGLASLLHESRDFGATTASVDYDALEASLREKLLIGDGSERSYVRTLWQALLAIPQGHQQLTVKQPKTLAEIEAAGFTLGTLTRYGACLRPYADHAVVTYADGRTTKLKPGDEVVAIDGKRGEDLVATVLAEPLGMDFIAPTRAGRLAFALRSWFSVNRENVVLHVRRPGRSDEVEVVLPNAAPIEKGTGCDDAFGRDYTKPAVAETRTDGTAVLYVPSFAQQTVVEFEEQVGKVFDDVKNAPRLVIDVRGNTGGLLKSALDLAAQLPNAKRTAYCEFFDRTPNSSPPSYTKHSAYSVDPEAVPKPPRFPFGGRIAVLVDGATHSSGEHFARAAKLAAGALIVGTPTAGEYGNVTRDVPKTLPGTRPLSVTVNRSQVRAVDGTPLDTKSVTPDVEIGYEPAAIAGGHDPMLERAIESIR